MKKGIFERCLSETAAETLCKLNVELTLLEGEVLNALTDNGVTTSSDDVILLLILEPFVAEMRRRVDNDPRARLLFDLLQLKIKVSALSQKVEGDHHV